MAAVRLALKCLQKSSILRCNGFILRGQCTSFNVFNRKYSNIPLVYNSEKDPAPSFFSLRVQKLLKHLTRVEYSKVFRKRNGNAETKLSAPEYKFMTDEQLKQEMENVALKADYLLQMPPIVAAKEVKDTMISDDPAITGHDTCKFVFTDITFDVRNSERLIVVRESDGKLHHANSAARKRLNQIYFPMPGRTLKEPAMFTDTALFQDLLNRHEYEFILDRACVQYEPEDTTFQTITNQVYLHCDEQKLYDTLRSTRHFGPMAFYLAWNNHIDGLMLDLIQNGAIKEAVSLIALQNSLHTQFKDDAQTRLLAEEILSSEDSMRTEGALLNVELDEKCMQCIESYIQSRSSKKSQHELAMQAFRTFYKEKVLMEPGARAARGSAN